MSYFRTCPYCHANLDPGERCDCRGQEEQHRTGETYRDERQGNTERRVAVETQTKRPAWKF